MASAVAPPRPGSSRWARLRGVGAVAAVVVFLGTATMAPYSTPNAFADDTVAAMLERHGDQTLTSAMADEQVIDLSISVSEEESAPRSGAGSAGERKASGALYTLEQFMFSGAVEWEGYKFTYYSQQVLPGPGLEIPGRHVNADGYVSDSDGFIVLAGSAPKGTVYETPFGYQGKIYDRGTVGNHLDVYIR